MTGPPLKETLSGYPLKGAVTRFFTVFLFLIACLLAICILCPPLYSNQTKNILVLHSYNEGLEWTDRITQGIESAFLDKGQDIEFYFVYMDTKRIYDDQYLQHLYELYRHKFRNRRFDVVISSDNHAFNLLLAHHRELFPDTPVVFCGVNDFQNSMLAGHELITGVAEVFDIRSTLDVALKLQPEIKEVVVITDKSLMHSSEVQNKLLFSSFKHQVSSIKSSINNQQLLKRKIKASLQEILADHPPFCPPLLIPCLSGWHIQLRRGILPSH